MFRLEDLGWSTFFASQCSIEELEELVPARVAEEHRKYYRLIAARGELLGEVLGSLRHQVETRAQLPAVGDWVLVRLRPGEDRATIHRVLERRSSFSRRAAGKATTEQVVAANVDTVFVVTALDRDFNLRRIERYVAAVAESGAVPVVLLNKADVCSEVEERVQQTERAVPGVSAHVLSAATGRGCDTLGTYMGRGRTIALIGSSGVGKSTLINRLLGEEKLRTAEISAATSRGRHTTTSRRLVPLPGGALLMDTPGMRELQLWNVEEGIGRAFDDIGALAADCRFADCSHSSEPGCAVQVAVETARLDPRRLESYRKLEREAAFQRRKVDVAERLAEQRRWKRIHKAQKEHYKLKAR